MIVEDIEEVKFTKTYEIRVNDDGELNTSEYQVIRDNINKYGFKVTDISGGTKVITITLEKISRVNHLINL